MACPYLGQFHRTEVLRRLDHPALPRAYRVFEEPRQDRLYLLMDYIAGPNLEQLCASSGLQAPSTSPMSHPELLKSSG